MEKCNNCGEHKTPANVPYIVHEEMVARAERQTKRLWITSILLILLLVGSNIAWLVYESQFEDVAESVIVQDSENGYNNYIGEQGDIDNGETNYSKEEI